MGKILCNVHEGVLCKNFSRPLVMFIYAYNIVLIGININISFASIQVCTCSYMIKYMHLIASVFNIQPVMSIYTGCPSTVNSKGINIMTVMWENIGLAGSEDNHSVQQAKCFPCAL